MSFFRNPARLSSLTSVVVLVALTGCRDAQEKARIELQSAAFSFTLTDFHRACGEGRLAIVEYFLKAGMNPNVTSPEGNTALITAAEHNQGEIVQLLISKGANPSTPGHGGLTPLLTAARSGDGLSLRALLHAGADPAQAGPEGITPLREAASKGHASLVELLVPVAKESLGPAFRQACISGHTAVMDVLLNAGADINEPDADHKTPLMLAAAANQLPAVKLLCHRQAAILAGDLQQLTAAELARAANHELTAGFLEDWAARHPDPETPAIPDARLASTNPVLPPLPAPEAMTVTASFSPTATAPNVETEPPSPLAGARFTALLCDGMEAVPGLVAMTSYQLRPWPLLLKDVATDHESADVELQTSGKPGMVNVRVGQEIPGTDCVVEKLRRRRVYSETKEKKLVNSSEMVFRKNGTGEVFRASPDTTVLSSDSSALLRISGSPLQWMASAGDEFRLGTTLLKVTKVEPKTLTVENRLTRETAQISLPAR